MRGPHSEYCGYCGGEGKLYTSRYGGNDPDVWPIGKCEICDGTGFVERKLTAVEEIAAERERQVGQEGWTHEHDDQHDDESLALVAALYATPLPLYDVQQHSNGVRWKDPWPWHHFETYHRYGDGDPVFKVIDGDKRAKHSKRQRLVIAGALIIAEIERLDRAALQAQGDER